MDEKVNATTFEEHLDEQSGKIGTRKRDEAKLRAQAFMIGQMIKEARKEERITLEQLALNIGTTMKGYLSRIENGKVDIHLSTLFRIVEEGLGKKLNLTIS